MALDPCDPCCNPDVWGRNQVTYQQQALRILCATLAAIEAGGGGGGTVNESDPLVFCDDVGQFLRHIQYVSGVPTSIVDTELDGVTPYVTTGVVALCPVEVNASFTPYAAPADTRQFDTDPFNSVADQQLMPAVAGMRNYITTLTFSNSSVSTVRFIVKDGATKIFSLYVDADSAETVTFPVALRSSVNTALNVATDAAIANALVAGAGYVSLT